MGLIPDLESGVQYTGHYLHEHHNLTKLVYLICIERHEQIHVKKLIENFVSVCVLNIKIVLTVIYFMYMNFLLSLFQSNVEGEEEKRET